MTAYTAIWWAPYPVWTKLIRAGWVQIGTAYSHDGFVGTFIK